MKKLTIVNLFLLFALMFSSCAIHSGVTQNSAALSSSNFTYVKKNISETQGASYVFGIGGFRSKVSETARKNLLEKNPLKDNQTIVNLNESWKTSMVLPFFLRAECTITADIIEFTR